ncbi:hypothetical protein FKM82_030389 [Ascaphus truei]
MARCVRPGKAPLSLSLSAPPHCLRHYVPGLTFSRRGHPPVALHRHGDNAALHDVTSLGRRAAHSLRASKS